MGVRSSLRLLVEFGAYLRGNKHWWLAPILLAIVVLSLFLLTAQSSVISPLLYTLF